MHDNLALRPWFVWLVYAVTLLLLAGAIAVIANALRRPASDFGRLGRWPWVAIQGLFIAFAAFAVAADVLEFGLALPSWFAGSLGGVVVVAAIQQVAYLLRVVFPSPRRSHRTPGDSA